MGNARIWYQFTVTCRVIFMNGLSGDNDWYRVLSISNSESNEALSSEDDFFGIRRVVA
jgi:hypothetical protein